MNDGSKPATPIRKVTLAEQIVDYVRDRISQNILEPGARLTIQGLATELNVSMTPVREAIRTLTAMKLVDSGANRSVTVARPDMAEILDLWRVYNRLEAFAAEILAERRRPADVADLQNLADLTLAAADAPDPLAYFHANQEFHLRLVTLADSPALTEMHASLNARLYPFRFRGIHIEDDHRRVLAQEHFTLIDAIAAGEAGRMAALMEYHSRAARKLVKVRPSSR